MQTATKPQRKRRQRQTKVTHKSPVPKRNWGDEGEGFGWRLFVASHSHEPEGVDCPTPESLELWAETLWS